LREKPEIMATEHTMRSTGGIEMKHLLTALVCLGFLVAMASAADKPELRDRNDKTSYSVGYQIGGDFKRQGVELNPEALVRGIQDATGGVKPLMSQEEMKQTLVDLKRRIVAFQQEELEKMAEKNLSEGEAFRQENGKKEGVATLPSGLQYRIIKQGTGASPKPTDKVTVHYRGTLIDGTEFDSSYARNNPATFQVDRVIRGWTEALQMMKEGSKWQLFLPPGLAYGERGAGAMIPPNSTLIFEVELLSVVKGS
jgi:FKBP-type peptidyl-prolyl cis-trans isomerase FklB